MQKAILLACLVNSILGNIIMAPIAWAAEPTPDNSAPEAEPTPLHELSPEGAQALSPSKAYDQALTVHKISIEGNQLVPEETIRQALKLQSGSLYSRQALQSDLRRVYDLGYFTEKIKAIPISTRDGIHLRIEVQENAPVTGVNIQGSSVVSQHELQALFADQTGLPQNIAQLNESIAKIEKLYADKGYVLAKVSTIKDDPDGTINLEISEGRIANIQFVGNRKTHDFVIRRALSLKEGDLYNENTLKEDMKRLYNSQSFSDVRRVITASPSKPGEYNLSLELDEKKTGTISLGGGIDTITGAFGQCGYQDNNFLGRGHSFSTTGAVGSGTFQRGDTIANARTYQFDTNWFNPSLNGSVNSLGVGAYGRDLSSFNVPLAVERRIGSDVTWSRPLLATKSMSMSLTARGENINLRERASTSDLARYDISKDDRKSVLKGGTYLSLSPTVAMDTRDNRFNPTSGWFNTATLLGAYGLSTDSYASAGINLRRYIKVGEASTLAFNTQAGHSITGDIPEFNAYRLGGAYSVRGFQEGGLGTGNGFLMASAELRTRIPGTKALGQKIPFFNTMQGVLFADVGQVLGQTASSKMFDKVGLGASIGVGVRMNIPGLGPMRLDYAIPLLGTKNDDFIRRFGFGVGQKF